MKGRTACQEAASENLVAPGQTQGSTRGPCHSTEALSHKLLGPLTQALPASRTGLRWRGLKGLSVWAILIEISLFLKYLGSWAYF